MRYLGLGLLLATASVFAHAQRAPDAAQLPQHQLATPTDALRPGEMARITGRSPAPRDVARPEEKQRITSQPNEAELTSHRHYRAMDGHEVHSPAKSTRDQVPAGASAKCRDGTYSFSQHRRGTCSHHGGVSSWL